MLARAERGNHEPTTARGILENKHIAHLTEALLFEVSSHFPEAHFHIYSVDSRDLRSPMQPKRP